MSDASTFFRQPCRFIAGAATIESLPPISVPEIAFIGRSNVGKSSLINTLIGQKSLVKTSKNPGHTKQLNFFLLGNNINSSPRRGEARWGASTVRHRDSEQVSHHPNPPPKGEGIIGGLMLVDMPGYGFAKVSKEKKGEWDYLIRSYLSGRPTLKRACLLIDARRGVMKPDEEFMDVLDEAAQSFQIVLTKIDAVTSKELTLLLPQVKKTIQSHPAAHPEVIATSTFSKEGIDALQAQLTPFAQ